MSEEEKTSLNEGWRYLRLIRKRYLKMQALLHEGKAVVIITHDQ
jgi:hypothetical protein